MSDTYLAERIDKAALNRFFEGCELHHMDLHALVVYHKNELVIDLAQKPYTTHQKAQLYSLSKSFASTAIGLAVQEGLLSLSDRAYTFFPTLTSDSLSTRAKAVTLRDLLTMRSGHAACVMEKMVRANDPAAAFFAADFAYEPGTHFVYNTGATYLLSAVLTAVTGMTLYDYLQPRFFEPLGIDASWSSIHKISEGGTGLHISCHDIATFGLVYLNEGMYHGRRILPASWVREATAKHADNAVTPNATKDWSSGYGYQFWRCSNGAYRADGAFGQLCVIDTERELVFAMQCELRDMQNELDLVYDLLDHIIAKKPTPDSTLDPAYTSAKPVLHFADESQPAWLGQRFAFAPNRFGLTRGSFALCDAGLEFCFSDGTCQQTLRMGADCWLENRVWIWNLKPCLRMIKQEKQSCAYVAAAYRFEAGTLHIYLRYLDTPHCQELRCSCENGQFIMDILCHDGLMEDEKPRVTGRIISDRIGL